MITVRVLCFLFFLLPTSGFAQVDYNKIILPEEIADSLSLGERLVQLAWQNNPQNEILARDADIAQLEVSKARVGWLNNVRISGNLNEYSTQRLINDLGGNESEDRLVNNFFPIYNFGVTLPIGIFFENPKNTKIAIHELEKTKGAINAQKISLRAAVLAQYQDFLMNRELLEIQNSMTENEYAAYQLAEQQFADNAITIEEYEEVLKKYNLQRMNTVRAQKDFLTSKILLEEFIGMRLEDVR
jgi:outer membrane protein TolC